MSSFFNGKAWRNAILNAIAQLYAPLKHGFHKLQRYIAHIKNLQDPKIALLKVECEALLVGKCARLNELASLSESKLLKTEYEL